MRNPHVQTQHHAHEYRDVTWRHVTPSTGDPIRGSQFFIVIIAPLLRVLRCFLLWVDSVSARRLPLSPYYSFLFFFTLEQIFILVWESDFTSSGFESGSLPNSEFGAEALTLGCHSYYKDMRNIHCVEKDVTVLIDYSQRVNKATAGCWL